MIVSQLMTKTVWHCRIGDNLDEPAHLMWDHDVGCVPVTDDAGAVVGMITDRDICIATYTQGLSPSKIAVASAMSKILWTASPDDDLGSVARRMAMHQLRRMPVLDAFGRLVGIITLGDLARCARHAGPIAPAQVSYTLATITAPRMPAIAAEPEPVRSSA